MKALEQGGTISAAARILNVSRSTVREKMKKYDIGFGQHTDGVEI